MSPGNSGLPVQMNLMRIVAQGLVPGTAYRDPVEVVRNMLATQGQMASNVPHSLIVRTTGSVGSDVTRAFADRKLVRSWPFRGTLHITTAEDYRWLRAVGGVNSWYERAANYFGIEAHHADHAREVALEALAENPQTRASLKTRWLEAGVGSHLTAEQQARLIYIIFVKFHDDGSFVSGPQQGNEHLIINTDEIAEDPTDWAKRIDDGDQTARREALAEVALRYVTTRPCNCEGLCKMDRNGNRSCSAGHHRCHFENRKRS